MENYQPNSHKYKEEQKQLAEKRAEKIVTGKAKRKKNEMRKFSDIFLSEDVGNVKTYIISDVLIPAAKKAIFDAITNGLDMIMYGSTGRTNRGGTNASKVSYKNFYDQRDRRYPESRSARTRYSYDDIVLDSRGEAEAVLSRMDEMMDTYGLVRVADLYDLVGVTGDYTDNDYGWTNIRNAEIVRTRDGGYMIKMPRALPISK